MINEFVSESYGILFNSIFDVTFLSSKFCLKLLNILTSTVSFDFRCHFHTLKAKRIQMEARTCNANVQFENYYAYNNNSNSSSNMSGLTSEQTQYERATMIQGRKFNNSFNGIEFMADELNDELQVSNCHTPPDLIQNRNDSEIFLFLSHRILKS